ncbi:hypothetical protein SGL43_02403 [Streptomyces globisporus]|uniref:Uncharacterized protein n=1 Tax=Streptomyces globisporus TaxID=1908 RepID=A0ABM9GV72_STRGL|nr:hypothetical protein SGL43_02403 [Streptomyces globisporus]
MTVRSLSSCAVGSVLHRARTRWQAAVPTDMDRQPSGCMMPSRCPPPSGTPTPRNGQPERHALLCQLYGSAAPLEPTAPRQIVRHRTRSQG